MTTDELIEELKKYPTGTKVFVSNPESAPHDLKRINSFYFDPFWKMDKQTDYEYTGIGILDLMKGDSIPEDGELICVI